MPTLCTGTHLLPTSAVGPRPTYTLRGYGECGTEVGYGGTSEMFDLLDVEGKGTVGYKELCQ
eukprot:2386306-Rhodomonas_salina.1